MDNPNPTPDSFVLKKGLNTAGTVIMDFVVEKEERVFPLVPAGAPITDRLLV